MQVKKSNERGHANHGWLDSYHSFSFSNYYDVNNMNFSELRVINEDVIAPAKGFGTHSHKDMEIITYILQGELAHKDSMGNVETLKQGYVQRMSAGTGVSHSEFNASDTNPVHLLQIWITPNQLNLRPGYEDKFYDTAKKLNQWCLLASQNCVQNSLVVHQDIELYAALLADKTQLGCVLKDKRKAYLQVAVGSAEVNGQRLDAGDAAMFDASETIQVMAADTAGVLLFDLP